MLGLVLNRIAGGGTTDAGTAPINAKNARLSLNRVSNLSRLAAARDGSIYFSNLNHALYRVDRQGQMTLVAGIGNGAGGYTGDGPADLQHVR